MKRSDASENSHQNKEPRLEYCESSRPEQPDVRSSLAVKSLLRGTLELRQTKQSEEIAAKSYADSSLKQWAAVFAEAGYHCEVRSLIVSDVSPVLAPESAQGRESSSFALFVEQSSSLFFNHTSGPFQAARLVIYADGDWRFMNTKASRTENWNFLLNLRNWWISLRDGSRTNMFFARV